MLVFDKKYPTLAYDPVLGKFYRITEDASNKFIELFLDDFGYLSYRCYALNKNIRKKGLNLAWEMTNGKLVSTNVVYAKDFNVQNIRLYNIGCVTREIYRSISDALKNTNGSVRLTPHKTDAYSYVLKFRQDGKIKKIIIHDIVSALKEKRKILLKSLKLLNKYLVSS